MSSHRSASPLPVAHPFATEAAVAPARAASCSLPAIVVLACVLTGCGALSPGGPPTSVEPLAAAAWQSTLPPAAAAGADLAGWWQRFDDPLLAQLIAASQEASSTLASAGARIARARATRVQAGAALLPTLDAVGSASQGRSVPRDPVLRSSSVGVQAGWEVDLFGGASAGRSAAQARLEGAQAAWYGERIAVAAETATSYVALRACEAQLVQTRIDSDSRAETSRLTEAASQAGFTPPADAALARAGAAQARSQVVSQRASCDTLLKSLVELTDLPEPALRQRLAAATARLPQPDPISLAATAALPAELLARRPDLADAARQVEAAAADQRQTVARQRPQVTLSGNLAAARVSNTYGAVSGPSWSFGPLTVTFPLFDGGARAAAVSAARAGYDEAVAGYRGQVRRAVREVEVALVTLQADSEREADARLAAQDYESSLRATEARQRGGLASLFDLENARRSAVAAQSALIDLQRERVAAWISLYRALGGGWTPAELTASADSTALMPEKQSK